MTEICGETSVMDLNERFKFEKMSLFPKSIYRFNSNLIKSLVGFSVCVWNVKS